MAYVGKEPVRGQNRELDDISGSFNGGNTAFTMQVGGLNTSPGSVNQVFISLGGVMQNPGTDFTVASSTITFTTPPANGLDFWGLIQGDAVDINTPADASVTESKLNANAPTNDHVLTADATTSGGFKWAAVSAGTTLTGSTNNTITTVTGANAIAGEANLTFDGKDMAIGVTSESGWASDATSLQIGGLGAIWGKTAQSAGAGIEVGYNVYDDNSTGQAYIVTDEASKYRQDDGHHYFYTASSGTADAAITFDESLRIKNNGMIFVNNSGSDTGTAGGNYQVVISTAGNDTWDGLSISGMKSGYNAIQCMPGADATYYPMYIRQHDDTYSGKISCYTNNTVSYDNASDYRLKQNDVEITDGIAKVKLLRPIRFEMKCDPGNQLEGFFAHEVQEAVPLSCAANGTKDQVDSNNKPIYQGMDYSKITPILTAALKEAIAKIETLETKVAALESA